MLDVLIEANASEFINNKPLNANSLIGCWRLSLNTLPHLFESESASGAARSFNIYPTSSKSAESDVIKLARSHRLSKATGP